MLKRGRAHLARSRAEESAPLAQTPLPAEVADSLDAMTESALSARLAEYQWYHIIRLTATLATPGNPDFAKTHPPVLRQMDSIDFQGKRVLDVGCRDGLFSFEAERRGAAEILGIDTNLSRGAIEVLIPLFQSRVQMRELSLYELVPEEHGRFDVILFPGVLYHLRYPFQALKSLADLLPDGGRMLVETGIFTDGDQRALLFCPIGEESPYERSSVTFFNRKGMIDSLISFGLRTEATDWISKQDRQRTDGGIVRGTFLCTKDSTLADGHPHHKWSGGVHKTWEKRGAHDDSREAR